MSRVSLPEPIKRVLRQSAGFGCCVCGHPFVEYHHIQPYSAAPHHDPAQMMVLCPNHHHEATVGAFPVESQFQAKARPYNVVRGFADGLLKIDARELAVEVGTNYFVGAGLKLLVDSEPLLALTSDRDGRLALSVTLYDESDNLLLLLDKNEWVTGDPLPWDVEYGYNMISVRRKRSDISLDVNARNWPITVRGRLHRKGQVLQLNTSTLRIDGVLDDINFKRLGLVAMHIVVDTSERMIRFGPYSPFRAGMIVSNPDDEERLRLSLDAYRKLAPKARIGRNAECFCGTGRRFKSCCGSERRPDFLLPPTA
jgi:hypothetical protein